MRIHLLYFIFLGVVNCRHAMFRLSSSVILQSTLDTLHFRQLIILTQTTTSQFRCFQFTETTMTLPARVTLAVWTCCIPVVLLIISASACHWKPLN